MEFNRIVAKNLKQEFYESIDQHSPHLIEIFRSKRGNVGQLLTKLSQQTRDSDDDDSFRHIDFRILLIEHESAGLSSLHLSPALLKIFIEGEVVMDNITDLPKLCAFCLDLHMHCVIQQHLELGHSELKPRLQTLKNQLPM